MRAALSSGEELEYIKEEPLRKGELPQQLVSMAGELCARAGIKPAELERACVASFGPMDLARGELMNPVHLFPTKRVPIVEPLQAELKVPVYLLNDCIAAAIGEHELGAAIGVSNFVFLNIGVGIGAGVYVDGRVVFGKDGNAHEVGHFTVDPKGECICTCGRKGHWEAYCSGPGMVQLAKLRGYPFTTPEAILEAAEKGDEKAVKLMEEVGRLNAIGLGNVVNAYDPEVVVLGGGVGLAGGELIIEPMRKHLPEYAVNAPPEFRVARLGDKAGLYGAIIALRQDYLRDLLFLRSIRKVR